MKAIVFVDVQKDFIDGALRNEKAIETTPKIVEWAKELMVGSPDYRLYATRDTHQASYCDIYDRSVSGKINCYDELIPYNQTLEGQKLPVAHCIEMTDGWMIDSRLMEIIEGSVTVVNKPTFGSFDLAEILIEDQKRDNFVFDEIILCGFCTSICVLANAVLLRAKFPNVNITVMKDLCACVTSESHDAALKVLEMQQINIRESVEYTV